MKIKKKVFFSGCCSVYNYTNVQGSIQYALECLRKLTTYNDAVSPKVFVLENHFEVGYLPQHSEPSQVTATSAQWGGGGGGGGGKWLFEFDINSPYGQETRVLFKGKTLELT